MKLRLAKNICLSVGLLAAAVAAQTAAAQVVITEVDPYGSNSSDGYAADWFELTNTGTSTVSLAGWTMIDSHAASSASNPYGTGQTISIGNSSNSAAALTLAGGVQSLAPGQSAVFLESTASAANSASLISSFETAWFGSKVPANILVGTYDDSGNFGLSQTSDMVNIFNGNTASASLVASVAFGADSGSPIATFDNTVGQNNTTLTSKSAVGVNGAFASASGLEIGSPDVPAVPEPSSSAMFLAGLGCFVAVASRRRQSRS